MAKAGAEAAAAPKLKYWYKPALYWTNVCLMVRINLASCIGKT